MNRLDCLRSVRFIPPLSLSLAFADREFVLPIERLEMPLDRIKWRTAKASPDGAMMTVLAVKGEIIPIDSSALRCLVDETYAAAIMNAIQGIKMSNEELRQLSAASQPPQQWLDEPDDVLRCVFEDYSRVLLENKELLEENKTLQSTVVIDNIAISTCNGGVDAPISSTVQKDASK